MIPWELIDRVQVPQSGGELRLSRRGDEFSIKVGNYELMNSRVHGSADALSELACARLSNPQRARILIGGLGMGYTLADALRRIGPHGQIVVAELVPAVVMWNRGPLADLAGRPLEDARVSVREVDVAQVLKEESQAYDAILMDVDNGPECLAREGNDWLYDRAGLEVTYNALRPGGVMALWSAASSKAFTRRLRSAGFVVEEARVGERKPREAPWNTIWLAQRRR